MILGGLSVLILFLAGRLLLGWFWGMLSNWELYLPISSDASKNHAETLVYPLILYTQFFIVAVYMIPLWTGMMGIWGLSKRMIGWSLGTTLVYLGIHALLSFEAVTVYIDLGLNPISPQISEKMMLGGLVSETIWPLLLMSILMLVYSESGFAVIRNLEYAFRLPESCKKDPEYGKSTRDWARSRAQCSFSFFFSSRRIFINSIGFSYLSSSVAICFSSWLSCFSKEVNSRIFALVG